MARQRITIHKLHRWAGLTVAIWLFILGLTGFLIDHREWRWEWNNSLPESIIPERVIKAARTTTVRGWLVNPDRSWEQVAIGDRGIWTTSNGGEEWALSELRNVTQSDLRPTAILQDPQNSWQKLWLATSNGLWLSVNGGLSFEQVVLAGEEVTSLTTGVSPDQLIAVIDRSKIVTVHLSDLNVVAFEPAIPQSAWPETFTLARYLHDLHVGKGIADSTSSILINDFSGLAWVILSITGFLYWYLPKRWKGQRLSGKTESPIQQRRKILVWLFNTHSSTLGILVSIPIIYLGVSGIYWDHMSDLGNWARGIQVGQSWLTPAFTTPRWENWIDGAALVNDPSGAQRWTVVGRMGVLTSSDNGATWQREGMKDQSFVESRRLVHVGNNTLIGNASLPANPNAAEHMGHNMSSSATSNNSSMNNMGMGRMGSLFLRHSSDSSWARINQFKQLLADQKDKNAPSEVSRWKSGQLFWRAGQVGYITDENLTELQGGIKLKPPSPAGVPLAIIFSKLHSGVLFWSEWKWINDAVVLLLFVLLVTGLIRWWRKKWLSHKPAKLA